MINRNVKGIISGAAIGIFFVGVAGAQYPGMPSGAQQIPGMGPAGKGHRMGAGIPQIPSAELTEKSARGAIDAYLSLRDKYEDAEAPSGKVGAWAKGVEASADVAAAVKSNGFNDVGEWQGTIASIFVAYSSLKDDKRDEMKAKIKEMESNTQIPAAFKDQLINTMKSVLPSDNNMNVIQGLVNDSTYGPKIADITK